MLRSSDFIVVLFFMPDKSILAPSSFNIQSLKTTDVKARSWLKALGNTSQVARERVWLDKLRSSFFISNFCYL